MGQFNDICDDGDLMIHFQVKVLEQQLEQEHEERINFLRERHELEGKIMGLQVNKMFKTSPEISLSLSGPAGQKWRRGAGGEAEEGPEEDEGAVEGRSDDDREVAERGNKQSDHAAAEESGGRKTHQMHIFKQSPIFFQPISHFDKFERFAKR